jgi:hypothetical protein
VALRVALFVALFVRVRTAQDRILGFQTEFANTATSFDWTFTGHNLHALLDRLDQPGRLAPAA